jgi:MOSC domain-containing protein YiiM
LKVKLNFPSVVSVGRNATHSFGKPPVASIRLLAGLGVEGDAHATGGFRQLHLLQAELFDTLRPAGFDLAPGQLGENITTRGIDLPSLPAGTRLRLGECALVELSGTREPCDRLERFRAGLLRAVLVRDAQGRLCSRAGVMAIVLEAGEVRPGDRIGALLPLAPHRALSMI